MTLVKMVGWVLQLFWAYPVPQPKTQEDKEPLGQFIHWTS